MKDYDILGFDANNAIKVTSTEEMRIVVKFAEEHGHRDYYIDDGEYDADEFPFICLVDFNPTELNAFAASESKRFNSIIDFEDWYSTYILRENTNLNFDSLSSLL